VAVEFGAEVMRIKGSGDCCGAGVPQEALNNTNRVVRRNRRNAFMDLDYFAEDVLKE